MVGAVDGPAAPDQALGEGSVAAEVLGHAMGDLDDPSPRPPRPGAVGGDGGAVGGFESERGDGGAAYGGLLAGRARAKTYRAGQAKAR